MKYSDIWELSSYHHISKKIVWKYYYTTISIWSPTNSGVKISVSLKGEIGMEILVYEKGGVIKHVKAPAINKVELLDLWKNGPRDNVE